MKKVGTMITTRYHTLIESYSVGIIYEDRTEFLKDNNRYYQSFALDIVYILKEPLLNGSEVILEDVEELSL